MTDEELLTKLQDLAVRYKRDPEVRHSLADELFVQVLREHGYAKSMDFFEAQERWYA